MAPGAYETEGDVTVNNIPETYLWVAMLLPTKQGNTTVTNFYGLSYKDKDISRVPDLYSGSGLFTDVNSASFTRLSVYPNTTAVLRTGSGTLSNLGNGVVNAQLSFPEAKSNDQCPFQLPFTQFRFPDVLYVALLGARAATVRSYGFSSAGEFTLNISAQGEISTSQTFQQDCLLTQGALAPSAYSSSLLTFTLTIPDATQCSLRNQTLNGAAFVTASPVAGKTQRLYIAGVTTDGRGISYIADR
jgi:hypothetical protein